MRGGEVLHGLDAAAMAMHVAEAADVHEDVEAELLASGERAREFVVLAAMAEAEVDDFVASLFADALDRLANLLVAVVTVAVDQGCSEFDLEGIGIEQIDQRRRLKSAALCISSAAACWSSRRLSIS